MAQSKPKGKHALLAWLKLWAWQKGWFVLILLALVFVAIFVCPRIKIPEVNVNGQERAQTLYLLSAVAQSLAAVFALVFTISLVVALLSSRYSHRILASFFDVPTILYILLFIISVLLPLWLLAEPYTTLVKFSIFLAATCLLLLIPYFLRFREKLSPEHLIQDFEKKGRKQLQANPSKDPEEVAIIDNFIMSAFVSKDYDTFKYGVNSLAGLALEAAECRKRNKWESELKVSRSILTRLKDVGIVTIKDPRAPFEVAKAMGDVGLEVVKQKTSYVPGWVSWKPSSTAWKTLQRRQPVICVKSASKLLKVE